MDHYQKQMERQEQESTLNCFPTISQPGNNRTSFDGETTAINKGLHQLLLRPMAFKKAVLLVDSKAAIQAIDTNKQATSQTVNEARKTIKLLNRQGKTVVFQWVPSHVGIHGNEKADLLANKGTSLYIKQIPPNYKIFMRLINNNKFKFCLTSKLLWL
jgi:ribonuclease HI